MLCMCPVCNRVTVTAVARYNDSVSGEPIISGCYACIGDDQKAWVRGCAYEKASPEMKAAVERLLENTEAPSKEPLSLELTYCEICERALLSPDTRCASCAQRYTPTRADDIDRVCRWELSSLRTHIPESSVYCLSRYTHPVAKFHAAVAFLREKVVRSLLKEDPGTSTHWDHSDWEEPDEDGWKEVG